jgi:hypothetical protein
MLVEVIQQHNADIHQMKESLKSMMGIIDLMAKHYPGLLQLQMSEYKDMFEDRATIITNAIQHLHYRTPVLFLLIPDKMEIMHNAVTKSFYNQAKTFILLLAL